MIRAHVLRLTKPACMSELNALSVVRERALIRRKAQWALVVRNQEDVHVKLSNPFRPIPLARPIPLHQIIVHVLTLGAENEQPARVVVVHVLNDGR